MISEPRNINDPIIPKSEIKRFNVESYDDVAFQELKFEKSERPKIKSQKLRSYLLDQRKPDEIRTSSPGSLIKPIKRLNPILLKLEIMACKG